VHASLSFSLLASLVSAAGMGLNVWYVVGGYTSLRWNVSGVQVALPCADVSRCWAVVLCLYCSLLAVVDVKDVTCGFQGAQVPGALASCQPF
jgi:hypothetical protein